MLYTPIFAVPLFREQLMSCAVSKILGFRPQASSFRSRIRGLGLGLRARIQGLRLRVQG